MDAAPPSSPAPDPREERDLLLWRVEKDGAVSWFLGTCHLPIPLERFLPQEYAPSLLEARLLYTEADLAHLMENIGMLFSEGSSLREDLGEEGWGRLLDRLPSQVPAPFLDRLRPWVVHGLVAAPGQMAQPGVPPVDLAVVQQAEQAGVELRFLESIEFQVELLASMEEQLLQSLTGEPAAEAETRAGMRLVASACNHGDLAGFEEILDEAGNDPSLEKMFGARNRAWMELLEPELLEGEVFVAVGTGHMPGPDGLLDLAEQRGFEVQRMRGWVPVQPEVSREPAARAERDPARDSERVILWQEALDPIVQGVCVSGNPIHDCFAEDTGHCLVSLRADLGLCLEQNAPHLPAGVTPQSMGALAPQMVGCGSTGLVADALATGRPMHGPVCEETMGAVRTALEGITAGTK